MTILGELQRQNAGSWVELFEVDSTAQGGGQVYFHAGTNGLATPVVWQGQAYEPFPIQATGFEVSGQQMPRPKLAVANVSGVITALLATGDLLGAKVIRRRTMVKYLDEVNFPARRNLLTYTEDFGNAVWQKVSATVATDAVLSPDGTMTADLITDTNVAGLHSASLASITYAAATVYTASVYAKPNAAGHIALMFPTIPFGATTGASFDIQNGTVVSSLNCTAVIRSAANGWFRCSITATATVGGNSPITDVGGYTGTGLSAYIWGAQLEAGNLTDYQAIPAATFQRNPTADSNAHLADEIYYIAQKTQENHAVVEFELGSPIDLQGVTIPRRQIVANLCLWQYRGEGCGYAGGAVADANDQPTAVLANDKCSKRLSGCKLRFGDNNELPYGGFPSAGLVKF